MSQEFNVLKLDPVRLKEAGGVLARAFCHDPVVCSILRGLEPEKRTDRLKFVFELNLKAIEPRGLTLCVKKGNGLSGVAMLYPPGTYPLPFFSEFHMLVNAVLRKGFYGVGRWMEWKQSIQKRHPQDSHYYLESIGVDPSCQGIGVGSSILKNMIDLADQRQVNCYLETANPANLPLYERFGFKIIGEEKIIGVPTWFMERSPRSISNCKFQIAD